MRLQRAFASLTKVACALAGVVALGASLTSVAGAQSYPERPVALIVPYPAGGAIDASARRLADFLSRELGQPVLVENRQGANSIVGTTHVAQAQPDGYTLLYTTLVAQAGNVVDYDNLPYDTFKDFVPITAIQAPPNVLVAHPSFPPNNVAELVEYAKKNPNQVTFGTNGPGSPAHLRGVQIVRSGGVEMTLVSYPGGAAALTDLVGGHINLYPAQLNSVVSFIGEGQLKVLAALGKKRLDSLPNVPSITETPGFEKYEELATFPLILAPAGTPPEIVAQLHDTILKIIGTEEFRKVSATAGEYPPFALTPDEAGKRLVEYIELLKGLAE
jgi:tripartite-type tricarboxylate transporter receptor subunit TctC